jgi:hypothetical protein
MDVFNEVSGHSRAAGWRAHVGGQSLGQMGFFPHFFYFFVGSYFQHASSYLPPCISGITFSGMQVYSYSYCKCASK